ncbi:MAG: DUF3459 domain-containing protein, partial [Acidimicrobiales bacterium]
RDDPGSVLHLYQRLLAARHGSPALQLGVVEVLPSAEGTLVWSRAQGIDERVIAVSFTDEDAELDLDGSWVVEVASAGDGSEAGTEAPAVIGPDTGLLLRRA